MATPTRMAPASAAMRPTAGPRRSIWKGSDRKCCPTRTHENPRSRASRTYSSCSAKRRAASSPGANWSLMNRPKRTGTSGSFRAGSRGPEACAGNGNGRGATLPEFQEAPGVLQEDLPAHLGLEGQLLELLQPAVRREHGEVGAEEHLVLQQGVGVLDHRGREV